MTDHAPYDPELHLLRSAAHASEGRGRPDLEAARFALWRALAEDEPEEALRWIAALDVALRVHAREDLRESSLAALERIRVALDAEQ